MHMLIQLAANPGTHERDINGFGLTLIIAIAVTITGGAVGSLGEILGTRWRRKQTATSSQKSPHAYLVFIGGGLMVCALLGSIGASVALSADQDSKQSAYEQSISSWLAADYNIDVTPDFAARLLTENLVVDFDGRSEVVSILEDGDGNLEVVNEAGDVVKSPRATR